MIRKLAAAVLLLAAFAAAPSSQSQNRPQGREYTPPAGVEMEIVLYPISGFRGNSQRYKLSEPVVLRPMDVESIYLVRGVWLLCNQTDYYGRCVVVSGSQQRVAPPFPVRSVRLIGDTGPTFVESPQDRAGSDVPIARTEAETQRIDVAERAAPIPVVAPSVEEGGVPGNNPSLAGRAVTFYAAPAQNGRRALACSQAPGVNPPARCIQASADGFCVAMGFRDSGWREVEVVNGRAYLVNVLCKQAADSDGARDSGGFRLPFTGG